MCKMGQSLNIITGLVPMWKLACVRATERSCEEFVREKRVYGLMRAATPCVCVVPCEQCGSASASWGIKLTSSQDKDWSRNGLNLCLEPCVTPCHGPVLGVARGMETDRNLSVCRRGGDILHILRRGKSMNIVGGEQQQPQQQIRSVFTGVMSC